MDATDQQWIAELATARSTQAALELVVAKCKADSGTLHRMGSDGLLHLDAIVGQFPPPVMDAIRTIPVGKGLAGLAAQRRAPVTVCNLQTDMSGDVRPGAKATGLEGAITVPCLIGSDSAALVGVLGIASRSPREYSDSESAALMACGAALARLMPA
ncbi:MAG: GAF domain-containing protein [Phycisphaerales bacterium]|nr:GAF domain-containing protein [Phycisphaerales bacterium]